MQADFCLSFAFAYLRFSLGLSGDLIQILINTSGSRFRWQRNYIFKTELLPLCERFPHKDDCGGIRVCVNDPTDYKGIVARIYTKHLHRGALLDREVKKPCVESMAADCLGFAIWGSGQYDDWDMTQGAKQRWLSGTKHALFLCALWNELIAALQAKTTKSYYNKVHGTLDVSTQDASELRKFVYNVDTGVIFYTRIVVVGRDPKFYTLISTVDHSEQLEILPSGCAQLATNGETLEQEVWCKLVREWIDVVVPDTAPAQRPQANFYQE